MHNRTVSEIIAFAIGLIIMPFTPFILAAVIWNESGSMEDW